MDYILYIIYRFMILNKSKLLYVLVSNIIIFLLWPTIFSLNLVWGIIILFCGLYIYVELLSLINFKDNITLYLLSLVLSIFLIITGFVLICQSFHDIYVVIMNIEDLLNPFSDSRNNNGNTGSNNPRGNPGPNNPGGYPLPDNNNKDENQESNGYNPDENQGPNNNPIQYEDRARWYIDDAERIIIYDTRNGKRLVFTESIHMGKWSIRSPVCNR